MSDEKTVDEPETPNEPEQNKQNETLDERVNARYKVYNLIATTLIALATLAFSAYLFTVGQVGIGGTIAGMVIAHYFQSAGNSQTVGAIRSIIETSNGSTKTRIETGAPDKPAA